jgi:hypothetical protein
MPVSEAVRPGSERQAEVWGRIASHLGAAAPFAEPDFPGPEYDHYESEHARAVVVDAVVPDSDYQAPEVSSYPNTEPVAEADAESAEVQSGTNWATERRRILGTWATKHETVRLDSLSGEERAKRHLKAVVDTVLGSTVESGNESTQDTQPVSLSTMLVEARKGSPEAKAGVRMNVATWLVENTLKVAAVVRVTTGRNGKGEMVQFGQTTAQREQNTLETFPDQSPLLRERAMIEGLNGFRIEEAELEEDELIAELSLVPAGTYDELHQDYFLEPMTLIMRTTERSLKGGFVVTSMLLGGVDPDVLPPDNPDKPEASERTRGEAALEKRFDIPVARDLWSLLNVEGAQDMSENELLGTPVKTKLNRFQLAMLYDVLASKRLGKNTFYGRTDLVPGPRPHHVVFYEEREKTSRIVQEGFDPLADSITEEVIGRSTDTIGLFGAVRLLSKVGGDMLVEYIATHQEQEKNIDTRAIGARTVTAIKEFRMKKARGDDAGAAAALQIAKDNFRDSSCPTGAKSSGTPGEDSDDRGLRRFPCPKCGFINKRPYNGFVPKCQNDKCKSTEVRC